MRTLLCGMTVVIMLVTACGDDSDSNGSGGKGGNGGSEFDGGNFCPDPKDSRVHYVSEDPNACIGVVLKCTREQNGFQNQCGCGCIDKGDPQCPDPTDPAIKWLSHDPAGCPDSGPSCASGEIPFNNTCGCGCTMPGS